MKLAVAAVLAVLTLPAAAQTPGAPAAKPPLKGDDALYSLGLAVSKSLEIFSLTPAELDTVTKGIRDGVAGKPRFAFDDRAQAAVQELARTRKESYDQKQVGVNSAYLAKVGAEKGAKKTASGAIVIMQKDGAGPSPAANAKVKVHYAGTLTDGTPFDSSYKRGQPAEFGLDQVIKCWTEAVQLMKVGGKARVVCPSDIAYGPNGRPPVIPGNAVLNFEIELLEIVK